jgi:hypothetical protein
MGARSSFLITIPETPPEWTFALLLNGQSQSLQASPLSFRAGSPLPSRKDLKDRFGHDLVWQQSTCS